MNKNSSDHYEPMGPIYMRIDGQSVPVPEVLTEQEVVRMLRLDEEGQDSSHTLAYYRDKGLLLGSVNDFGTGSRKSYDFWNAKPKCRIRRWRSDDERFDGRLDMCRGRR